MSLRRSRRSVLLALTAALVFAPFGESANGVVDGRPARTSEHPWFASFGCGATLIAADRILTAAHCLTRVSLRHDVREIQFSDGTRRRAARATVPPAWVASVVAGDQGLEGAAHDVAVVQLDRPVTHLRPVELLAARTTVRVGRLIRVIGVGESSAGGRTNRAAGAARLAGLRRATLELRSDRSCRGFYRRAGRAFRDAYVPDRMLCAGDPDPRGPQAATCLGDSGGPALVRLGSSWRQLGITSWGKRCGADKDPPVFVDVRAVRDFVGGPHRWGPVAAPEKATILGDARVGSTVECRAPAWIAPPERVLYEWRSYKYGDRSERRLQFDDRNTYVVRARDTGRILRCSPLGLSASGLDRVLTGASSSVAPS